MVNTEVLEPTKVNVSRKDIEKLVGKPLKEGDIISTDEYGLMVFNRWWAWLHCDGEHEFYRENRGYIFGYNVHDFRIDKNGEASPPMRDYCMQACVNYGTEEYRWARYLLDKAKRSLAQKTKGETKR
jgi:hypothetical protein